MLLQRLVPRVIENEASRWPNAEFVEELRSGLPPIAGEETYVEQVLRNLLGNAYKYGGTAPIIVEAARRRSRRSRHRQRPRPGLSRSGAREPVRPLLPLAIAVATASGAGIGLFVCRQLIAAMNGRMWADNREGGGAVFGFELPVFEA